MKQLDEIILHINNKKVTSFPFNCKQVLTNTDENTQLLKRAIVKIDDYELPVYVEPKEMEAFLAYLEERKLNA